MMLLSTDTQGPLPSFSPCQYERLNLRPHTCEASVALSLSYSPSSPFLTFNRIPCRSVRAQCLVKVDLELFKCFSLKLKRKKIFCEDGLNPTRGWQRAVACPRDCHPTAALVDTCCLTLNFCPSCLHLHECQHYRHEPPCLVYEFFGL